MKRLLWLLIILISSISALATSYTVCTSGCDYSNISSAISNSAPNDILNVASGVYNESVTINVNNLSLIGNASSRPQILGGIRFSTGLDHLIFSNFYLTGSVVGENTLIKLDGLTTNLTIDNVIFDGQNISGRHGVSEGHMEDDVTVLNSEFKYIKGWALFDSNSGSGGEGFPLNTVFFANNYVHDSEGTVVFRGLSTDWTDYVYFYNNTFENIGNEGVSDHWAAFEINKAYNLEIYNNVIRNVVENSWGEGEAMQLWQIGGTINIYNNIVENNFQGVLFLKWPANETYDISNATFYNNKVSGNEQYGLNVNDELLGGFLNASHNWWGNATGPGGFGIGSGDNITNNIVYTPFYTDNSLTQLTSDIHNDDGSTPADTPKEVTFSSYIISYITNTNFSGQIFLTSSNSNPANTSEGFATKSLGKYIDIEFSSAIDINNAAIKIYYDENDLGTISEGSLRLFFFNETSDLWQSELDSGVNVNENYVWANVNHFSLFGAGGADVSADEYVAMSNRLAFILSAFAFVVVMLGATIIVALIYGKNFDISAVIVSIMVGAVGFAILTAIFVVIMGIFRIV